MQARYVASRSLLLSLWLQHPDWTALTLAQATGQSVAWVKKWKARFRSASNPADAIWGRSHLPARGPRVSAAVVEQILAIRDEPPEQLQRTPGPKAILYYLPRTSGLEGELLPRSTRTIWKILRAADRIAHRPRRPHHPQDRPEPLVELQLDFKDVVQVDPLVSAKQAHAVEVLDAVDVGTPLWLMGEPSASYTAETVFGPLLTLLERIGLPERVRFDRDPRFLGSTSLRDFPTPFLRFWYALGVQPVVNPPHRPDLNAFVERLHGTIAREYRQRLLPGSLEATCESLPLFQHQYNIERPHQGRSSTTSSGPTRDAPAAIGLLLWPIPSCRCAPAYRLGWIQIGGSRSITSAVLPAGCGRTDQSCWTIGSTTWAAALSARRWSGNWMRPHGRSASSTISGPC